MFSTAGLTSNILSSLETHSAGEAALYAALEVKSDATWEPWFAAIGASLASIYNTTVALYD